MGKSQLENINSINTKKANMNSEIQKHIKKNKKNANAEVDIFNVNPQGDNTDKQAQRTEEEENDDYVIGGNIVNTDVANAHNQANLDVQKNIWEEKNEAIVYNETITVVDNQRKRLSLDGVMVSLKRRTLFKL